MSHCTIHGADLRCLNCGDFYTMGVPAPVRMVIAMSEQFQRDHADCEPSERGAARFKFTTPAEWLASWDTGQSAMTIANVMVGYRLDGRMVDSIPYDPSDFGRCYRLLAAFPAWRARLSEMTRIEGWPPLVAAWPELEKLYEEELPLGKAPKLYAALEACR